MSNNPFPLYNFYDKLRKNPEYHKQLNCRDSLFTIFNCPLDGKFHDMWSHHNYIVFVMEGRKIWHTTHGSYDLQKGSCVFVRKGACIVEQFFDSVFCIFLFFIPDEFICDTLKSKTTPIDKSERPYDPVMKIEGNETIEAFFHSMTPYFSSDKKPDESLLELKFREIILAIADNHKNTELLSYFRCLLNTPHEASLTQIMDDNFLYNLKLQEFARLCNRSLSAFKRDFQKKYNSTPGKWLLEKRLNHSMHLLTNAGRTVAEAAFDSGFESPSHFSRAFRQHFGVAPASLKQQISA